MAEPGPEPGRAWRVLALCGAAVFLAAAAAGGALVAWNLAASTARGPRCFEPPPGVNATAPAPLPDPASEVEELWRRLEEATLREETLAGRLERAERGRRELAETLRVCEGRQSQLQTQLKTLKIEMEEAKAQGMKMGLENGALTDALARWEAAAAESARRLEEARQSARAAKADGEACAAREVALQESIYTLETQLGPQQKGSHTRPRSRSRARPSIRSRSRSGPTKGCRRPPQSAQK
uniref:Coiled-coil domain containing 194 n=2 Tax=Jaculus jaculus TaxID=51337 RepID=A0A8C5KET7_JACJA